LIGVTFLLSRQFSGDMDLMEYFASRGVVNYGVGFYAVTDDNSAGKALRDFLPNEEIARIPLSFIIWHGVPEMIEIANALPGMETQIHLSVFLCLHRDHKIWGQYFESLPKTFHQAYLYNALEKELLAKTLLSLRIDAMMERIDSEFGTVSNVYPHIAKEDYVEAWTIAISRSFGLWIDDSAPTPTLVPFLDKFNHGPIVKTEVRFEHNEKTLLFKALQPIEKGEEVTVFYGNLADDDLLLNYGFTASYDNDANSICRLAFEDGSACDVHWGDFAHDDVGNCLSSKRNAETTFEKEKGLWHLIKETAVSNLAGFSTSIHEDDEILKLTTLKENELNCVRARRGEKVCLKKWAEVAEQVDMKLSLPHEQITSEWKGFDNAVNEILALNVPQETE